jgi:hypothetical protein
MKEQFLNEVLPQLIALAGTAITMLIIFLKSKVGKAIQEKAGSSALGGALNWGANLAFELVMAANQTQVDGIKKAMGDGKLTKEEYDAILRDTKSAVLAKLQEATLGKYISAGVAKTVEQALSLNSDLIESAIAKNKPAVPVNP